MKLKKLNPKRVVKGYDQGFIDGYNQAIDDMEIEKKKEDKNKKE